MKKLENQCSDGVPNVSALKIQFGSKKQSFSSLRLLGLRFLFLLVFIVVIGPSFDTSLLQHCNECILVEYLDLKLFNLV
jgi:hypothetical protein